MKGKIVYLESQLKEMQQKHTLKMGVISRELEEITNKIKYSKRK